LYAPPMQRRIFGIETEYGVTCVLRGQRRLSPDEVARYLFRRVVSWGRSSNVFLENGSRLYLDVGSHPEYATPECDSLYDLVAHDRAGERILEGLVGSAEERLTEEGIRGDIYLYRNNTDSAGNSYGCHENYLIRRHADFQRTIDTLIPYLVTRQIWSGAGKLLNTARGTVYSLAQRAEHIWEGSSSATTRSRPIINTRDEPHADAEMYRRLHVIAGDSNMSEYVTYAKTGVTVALLQMLEDEVVFRDLTLENPIRAIREISHDVTCRRRIRLANGRELSALDIQWEYLERVMRYSRTSDVGPEVERAISMWEHLLTGLEKDPMTLHREVDWVAKLHLMDRYQLKHNLPLSSPKLALIDLNYHDVNRDRGLYYKMERAGLMDRIVTDTAISKAMVTPPGTTRARLRGEFIRAAKAKRRDFTVDWVHLKLNDQAQRTVLCKDPFKAYDERVDRLIESL
jgi:proteasome accessory factor A